MQTYLHRQQTKWKSLHRSNSVLNSRKFLSALVLIALITCLTLSQKARIVRAESNGGTIAEQRSGKAPGCGQRIWKVNLTPLKIPQPVRVPLSAVLFDKLDRSFMNFRDPTVRIAPFLAVFDGGDDGQCTGPSCYHETLVCPDPWTLRKDGECCAKCCMGDDCGDAGCCTPRIPE